MSLGFVLAVVFSAFITGALARFALPGPDPMPAWLTIIIGLVGSLAGAVVGDRASNGNGYAVSFVSFGVAIGLVAAYRHFIQKRPIFGPGAMKFPERGIGVDQYRARLRKVGYDPDTLRPAMQGVQRPETEPAPAHLDAAIDELHRAGILDDEERQTLTERLTVTGTDTNVP